MIKLTINNIEVEIEEGATLLQACEQAGFEIPRFCYHEKLSVAGNCRMCLVDVEKAPKPVASCAMPAADGMVVNTQSARVTKARKGVMEFLLINHPLDCPICDQGGECDLQDQAMAYGFDKSRYIENKRAVKDKYMGPLIKTIMTRCIHCTRCVRFATEVAGVPDLGAVGRGENMEIITYLEKSLASELSANVVDLCPVGALTSKPYAFIARPWELNKTESIDVMDALGSNIRVDARAEKVMRVLPCINEDINEEWISDKTRYAIDGLSYQRLDRPYLRGRGGRLYESDWDSAFKAIATKMNKIKAGEIAAIAGNQMDAESMYALKLLMQKIGSPHLDCRQDGAKIGGARCSYLFNSGISAIDDIDSLLIIGCNPRIEAAVMNARIRARWLEKNIPIAVIGPQMALNYHADYLGDDPELLNDFMLRKNLTATADKFLKSMRRVKKPMMIIGMGALTRPDGAAILGKLRHIAENCGVITPKWNGFNILHNAAARVAGLDMGFLPQGKKGLDINAMGQAAASGKLKMLWLLGADELDFKPFDKVFKVYQGHHGDKGASLADVVLPGAAYTEKEGIYVNLEGRPQQAHRAVFPPGDAREDWAILRAFSGYIGKNLGFDSLAALREKMIDEIPHFGAIDQIHPAKWDKFGTKAKLNKRPILAGMDNFYMSCAISRASKTMAECIKAMNNNLVNE